MKNKEISPFTVEIIKDSLLSIGDEMFVALARTSMSPMFYEVLDYACGLTSAKGHLISQGNGVTSFIGMLSPMVQHVVETFGEDLSDGDIIIINDPYVGGGSHLSDVGLVMPIFYEGELVGFSANKGHWTEVGGKDPGSFTTDSNEIYQEGLQLPAIKLYEKGVLNQAIVAIIERNVRFPELSLGDLWAQVAALKTGHKRMTQLGAKYGKSAVLQSIEVLLNQGKELAAKEMKNIPNGVYEASGFIEAEHNGPYPIQVKVTVTDDEFICDFTGSHPQVTSPVNCSYYGLLSSVRVMFLAILKPSQSVNEGMFAPLKIITEPGTIVSAIRPAPVSMNFEARIGGADLIWKALAPVLPDRLTAGNLLSVSSVVLTGQHQDLHTPFLLVEPSVGGWGAGQDIDGQRGQFSMGNGETYNVPIEVAETRYGIMVDEYSFRADGAGAGEYVGGSGVKRSYRALSDGQKLSVNFGRHQFAPWGMKEGEDGSPSYVVIEKQNGEKAGPFGIVTRYELQRGDVVHLVTATGGGYGHPFHRPVEKVYEDWKNGFITAELAAEKFGVTIDETTGKIIGTYR
jgi:N-methylhydantoinase B